MEDVGSLEKRSDRWGDDIKMYLRNRRRGCEMDHTDPGWKPVLGCGKHSDKSVGSIKHWGNVS